MVVLKDCPKGSEAVSRSIDRIYDSRKRRNIENPDKLFRSSFYRKCGRAGWCVKERSQLDKLLSVITFFFGLFILLGTVQSLFPSPGPKSVLESINTVRIQKPGTEWPVAPIICDYSWHFNGSNWTWEIQVQPVLFTDYRNRNQRNLGAASVMTGFADYLNDNTGISALKNMTDEIKRVSRSERFTQTREIEFVTGFVANLPYLDDRTTTGYEEYPRYPVETLVDNGGDCEDKAILLASLLNSMGYDASLVLSTNHCAVGVRDVGGMAGESYLDNNERYYFIEATIAAGVGIRSADLKDGFRVIHISKK